VRVHLTQPFNKSTSMYIPGIHYRMKSREGIGWRRSGRRGTKVVEGTSPVFTTRLLVFHLISGIRRTR
jgi:hypothetical protein